jgi:hypothetical protein
MLDPEELLEQRRERRMQAMAAPAVAAAPLQSITFAVAPPASLKNRRQWHRRAGSWRLSPSEDAIAGMREIRLAALAALHGRAAWGPDDALHLELEHDVDADLVRVTVTRLGTLPTSGRRGTRRDCHGMIETVADALQGVLYDDDRQVDAGAWRRVRAGGAE